LIRILTFLLLASLHFSLQAQYHPAAGQEGCIAIHKDSSAFTAWASGVTVVRGMQQMGVDSLGLAWSGIDEYALGRAGDNPMLSLGDGGTAALQFDGAVRNGAGYDFAVFENSFDGDFLELAFVEVSSDGERFVRFPAYSETDTINGTSAFGYTNPEQIHNLAGKYPLFYGTPFDLSELQDSAGLDVENIRFIRIVDVVGSMDPRFCSRDVLGRKVADPWPTPFPSGGFDLDAVGAIHFVPAGTDENKQAEVKLYPQPASGYVWIKNFENSATEVRFTSLGGKQVMKNIASDGSIDLSGLQAGFYTLELNSQSATWRSSCIVTW
jgi:hypothetical protein